METIKYIDLFCGLGAFHTAFDSINSESKKYECVFACDIDENVRKIYKENYGIRPSGDINQINIDEIPDFDILCGGFPCQPFSIAGKKEGWDTWHLRGYRGTLIHLKNFLKCQVSHSSFFPAKLYF